MFTFDRPSFRLRQALAWRVPQFVSTLAAGLALSTTTVTRAQVPEDAATPLGFAVPTPVATPAPPPQAQAYVTVKPGMVVSYGRTLVPVSLFTHGLGASVTNLSQGRWRISYFGRNVDVFAYQYAALFDEQSRQLPAQPQIISGHLYVPWVPLAEYYGIKWKRIEKPHSKTQPKTTGALREAETTFLLQYPAAYIENVHTQRFNDRTRMVLTLSNPTRVVAGQDGTRTQMWMAATRRSSVPGNIAVGDYLVPRATLQSGNWRAALDVRTNYVAPVRWYTLGFPARIVIDFEKLFEESNTQGIGAGLSLTKLRRGTGHGPVQMFVVRVDPHQGWRLRIVPGGYSVLQRNRTSRIAKTHKALVAVNGGFFAPDGAAVGAMLINSEWVRLPWKGRTAVGFRPDGRARIANLQAFATAQFGSGLKIPVRDLNGWPDKGYVTALTRRFGNYYKLRSGEMAVVVQNGQVVQKPGGGGVPVPTNGFALVGSGAARPWLNKVARGEGASLKIQSPGWEGYTHALGGGPRLVNNGRIEVTALRENFRSDVRVGLGPRTALGLDKYGRYILLVVDGRQGYYSTGLTLHELAATMQKLGAVNALNLDGGGSTAMSVRQRVVNRPSDGSERRVANALLVMR